MGMVSGGVGSLLLLGWLYVGFGWDLGCLLFFVGLVYVCVVVCCLRYVGGLMLWFACLLRVARLCAECVVAVWVGCFGGFFRFSGVGCVVGSCVWHLRWFWVVGLAVCLLWLICLFIVRIGVGSWFSLF